MHPDQEEDMSPTFVEEYRTVDKQGWERGPWDDEPDKAVWVDQATGLDCMIVRNHSGSLCGYVGVPKGHRAYGRGYEDLNVVVHGGLTYAGPCQEPLAPEFESRAHLRDHGICHIPPPGRPEDIWWFGFDTGHFRDYQPAMAFRLKEIAESHPEYDELRRSSLIAVFDGEEYKTLSYVMAETTQLAEQIARLVP
jgi:hypothetical protein